MICVMLQLHNLISEFLCSIPTFVTTSGLSFFLVVTSKYEY
ncbi:hypothetical protein D915_002381 [Fasciola hepatica]|uniref:Uncharacterized protein n=1 Tax=Fasciola hepatica TaxID=6192 RepID=A0A4E0S306_FASHE|nr:hypothetical protein D915_002381 [Fasciola hepatica]